MENAKKLQQINNKIAELQELQKQLETKYIETLSKEIARIIIKKRAFNLDKSALLKKIEAVINDLQNASTN
ncbi:MAG: hypothetical protein K6C34_01485 [Alphaproteobacteria bacterium]|nr:hypothetical protein [Alphaproteobacteria bacterium]